VKRLKDSFPLQLLSSYYTILTLFNKNTLPIWNTTLRGLVKKMSCHPDTVIHSCLIIELNISHGRNEFKAQVKRKEIQDKWMIIGCNVIS